MNRSSGKMVRFASSLLLACIGFATGNACAQSTVDIANLPLFGGQQAHPNVAVTLSVEYPSVSAAYRLFDYVGSNVYLGYFNPTRCYSYVTALNGYFTPTADADQSHNCADGFSGNFMNWATMSAIDEFRYAMTGGNRTAESGVIGNGTLIQRAYLPDGSIPGINDFYDFGIDFPVRLVDAASTVLPATIRAAASGTLYVHSCKTEVYFGLPGGSCGVAPNSAPPNDQYGRFNLQVNVCGDVEGPLRPDLCLQYGGTGGRFRPVGEAQRNGDRMRFSAFGYLLDRSSAPANEPAYTVASGCADSDGWSRCRYGGVLRAPMKYVGPTNYDANLVQSVNTRAEFAADGTLIDDPEGNAATFGGRYSGFINYLNKFGSTGVYKHYDPMGELYYEAIRYFQNLGPTPEAIAGPITNATADHFPYLSTTADWSDPIRSSCSANYILNLSDTNTWDDSYLPGYAGQPSPGLGRPASRPVTAGLDAYEWTRRIGALEGDSSITSITPGDIVPSLLGLENRHTGDLAQHAFYFAAGASFWANVNDIRSDLPGTQTIKTLSFDFGETSNRQNADGTPNPIPLQQQQLYLMGKYGGFNNTIDRTQDTYPDPFFAASTTSTTAIRSNSEWESSTGSGVPASYFLASDPQRLISGVRAAFSRIGAPSGNLAAAALTSSNLTYGSAGAYVATFDPLRWSGSVLLDTLSTDANGNLVVSAPVWDSGALLTARCGTVAAASAVCADSDTSVNARNIVTTISNGGTRVAVPFKFADIQGDAAYVATLNTNPVTAMADGNGQARLNYLRGYRGDESSALAFRGRDSVMGDIIDSGPVFVGPPTSAIPDASYQDFFIANAARRPAVYVGANDGMLHAIDAGDINLRTGGNELFAYVPGYARADLNDLTNPGYQHDIFVDTVPKVQEAQVNGTWKTILVGANGNGAQGIFGLDVTDPTTFGPSKVLFEFSDADDADFGSTLAAPEFAKLWVSGPASAPVYRYFAVVTGYNNARTTTGNNHTDTSVSTDTAHQGVLFLIALDHTLGLPWALGTDYYKFKFPAANAALPNGLGPVTLLASKSGDRSTASMYFGDLQGDLWKFNTNTGDPTTWMSALGTATAPLPLFVAHDDTAAQTRQPITARVELANGPFGSTLVFFGTGKYLGQSDLTLPAAVQSEYSLLDVNPSVSIDRDANLVPRVASVSGQNVTVTGASFSYSGASAKKGWYLDFPSVSVGERSITKPAIRTGLLTFTTLTLSNDLCEPGNGFVYQVNALTGLAVDGSISNIIGYTSTVGIPGPPRVVDLTLTSGASQATGEAINLKTQTTLVSGTAGRIGSYGSQTPIKVPPTLQLNWREITNWNDRTGR